MLREARRRRRAQSREQHEAGERHRRRAEVDRRAACSAGLGTDGAASNNDLDMFEAMRVAALLHKVATLRSARDAGACRRWNWRPGAAPRRSGLGDRIGSLEAGKQADLITVTMDGARQTPMFDPISHLVYVSRGDDVRTTIVAGRVLMRDGQRAHAADATDVLRDARAMAERVRRRRGAGRTGQRRGK